MLISQLVKANCEHKQVKDNVIFHISQDRNVIFHRGVTLSLEQPELGIQIKRVRELKGLSLKELGDLLGGVDHSTLSKIENGKSKPSKRTLGSLANVLGDNFGDTELDQYINKGEVPKSKKEIIEETSVEEIFSIKFGGGTGRRSKEQILKLKRLVDKRVEQMLDES